MPIDKNSLRTLKAAFFWRWWDEAEHKSSPEKRLAFYDAMMRYIFRGDEPPDPLDMDNPTGADYAAYDATHYFDVIDSMTEQGEERRRGAQPGNRNASKKRIGNESETNRKTNGKRIGNENANEKTNPLGMKNEEGRMKNEEGEGERESPAPAKQVPRNENAGPSRADVLAWAADSIHKPDGKPIPEKFALEWIAIMEAATPPWTNTRGRSVAKDWKREMIFAWQREQKFNAERVRDERGTDADNAPMSDETRRILAKMSK